MSIETVAYEAALAHIKELEEELEVLNKKKLAAAADWLSSEGQWIEYAAKRETRIKKLEKALRTVFLVHHGGLQVDGHFQYGEDEDECIEIAIDAGLTDEERDWA